jgi:peptidoglycan/xylan/chitin deacetylase (PgdA/CDA1 family)
MYHSLDSSGLRFSTHPDVFRAHVETLAAAHVPCVPLEAIQATPGAVALTFDDGYRNFVEHALPLLLRYHIPATLFAVSGYCGQTKTWRPHAEAGRDQPLLSWAELRDIAAAGISIGGHSVHHLDLSALPDDQALAEMRDCRNEIEDRLGRPVTTFAYPYGASNPRIRELARQQFPIACGTRTALVRENSDSMDLPRIFDFYLTPYWLRRLSGVDGRAYIALRKWVSAGRGWLAG